MAEKLSVVMARKHLEAADIALLVIDATEGVSQLDASIAGYAHESGRSIIIVVNKWDLVISGKEKPARPTKVRAHARKQAPRRPRRLRRAPALRTEIPELRADRLHLRARAAKAPRRFSRCWKKSPPSAASASPPAQMNRFLEHVDFERASVPMRQRVKILYMTQASVAPPTFVLFTNRAVKLHFSYQRFLENQIREAFGFVGTPIWIKNRARNS